MPIFDLLSLCAALPTLSRASYRDGATPADKARLTRARTAVTDWCRANWPEYGRKVDAGWWAGPDHVSPHRDPMVVATLSQGCGGDGIRAHDGGSFSSSGCGDGAELYQHLPIGGIVEDHRADPYRVFGAPLLTITADTAPEYDIPFHGTTIEDFARAIVVASESPATLTRGEAADRVADRGADPEGWNAAHKAHNGPGGLSNVGILVYLAYWHRHGASVGIRTARDAVTWITGPRAGEVETFAPLPFYSPEHQPDSLSTTM